MPELFGSVSQGFLHLFESVWAELRRADSDAAAVAQLVNFIENVHDIETDFKSSFIRDLDPALQANVECLVTMVLLGICKTPSRKKAT